MPQTPDGTCRSTASDAAEAPLSVVTVSSCPHCHGLARVIPATAERGFHVACTYCGTEGPGSATVDGAISTWNKLVARHRQAEASPPEDPFARANRQLCERLGLLTCPFCGAAPRLSSQGGGLTNINCTACHAQGPGAFTEEAAATAWNRRPPPAPAG